MYIFWELQKLGLPMIFLMQQSLFLNTIYLEMTTLVKLTNMESVCKSMTALNVSKLTMSFPKWALFIFLISRYMLLLSTGPHPSYNAWDNDILINFLQDFCFGRETILIGDFNLPSLSWLSGSGLLGYLGLLR